MTRKKDMPLTDEEIARYDRDVRRLYRRARARWELEERLRKSRPPPMFTLPPGSYRMEWPDA